MDIDYDLLYEKFLMITGTYNNRLDHGLFSKNLNVGYSKDTANIYYNKNMFSKSLLHHINAKKCLIKRISKKLPEKSNPNEYTLYYFDSDNKLLYSSLKIDEYRKMVTVFFDKYVQIEYLGTKNIRGEESFEIISAEINEFDDNDNIIKCETFKNEKKPPYGTSISCEYYYYDDERLAKIESFENYNSNFALDSLIRFACPDRIINPEKFTYLFEKSNEDILVKKIRHYSESENRIENFLFKRKEINRLKSNGINCFDLEGEKNGG